MSQAGSDPDFVWLQTYREGGGVFKGEKIHNMSYFQKCSRKHNHVNALLGPLPRPWRGPVQVRRKENVSGSVQVGVG